jgi:hypothetical protein
MELHPEIMRSQFLDSGMPLTPDILNGLFKPVFSRRGSNRAKQEEEVISFWRDWLEEIGGKTLNAITASILVVLNILYSNVCIQGKQME